MPLPDSLANESPAVVAVRQLVSAKSSNDGCPSMPAHVTPGQTKQRQGLGSNNSLNRENLAELSIW
jgi:hypothetical protein